MEKNIVPIVFCFDEQLEMPAGVCITSLLANALPDTFYDIYILHPGSCDFRTSRINDLPKIYGNCTITYRNMREAFSSAFQIREITVSTYYRLLIPEAIPEYDKVIYSDVDVIFRDDLYQYYRLDLGNSYVGAVDVALALREDIRKYVEDVLNLRASNGYYYAGNLIINCTKIRQDGLVSRFLELAKNNYYYQDMDVLNIACNGNIKPLSPVFCLSNSLFPLIISKKKDMLPLYPEDTPHKILSKGIVHYNGKKPWQGWCFNMDIWWYYYRKSIFYTEDDCFNFYDDRINEINRWSLTKRLKHVLRYFHK